MTKKLSAAMVAVTALQMIRRNDQRHVPGTASADFEVDQDTAASLVASGAAGYADPEQAKQPGPDGGGSESGTGSEGSGAEAGGDGDGGEGSGSEAGGTGSEGAGAAAGEGGEASGNAAGAPDSVIAKPAAKTVPAKKVAAKKTAKKK